MKNFQLLLLAVLFSLPSLQAQENFKMGAKAGANFATIGGDYRNGEIRTGYHLGLVAEIPLSQKFSLGPEMLYSSQGSENGFKVDYIQVPLMAKYYITEGLSVEAGPQIGFLTSADVEVQVRGGSNAEFEDYLSSLEYGVNVGAGLKWSNGIFLQARYNLGLANIMNDPSELNLDDFRFTNKVIQVSVGYMF